MEQFHNIFKSIRNFTKLFFPDFFKCCLKIDTDVLVADLFLFCYERISMVSLSGDKQANITNTTSRYLDAFLTLIMVILTLC